MQWQIKGGHESGLANLFKDVVDRRNRLAHQLLAEFVASELSSQDARTFLLQSLEKFLEVRLLIYCADTLSSVSGSVAPDGSSLPRFKTTA